jgi:hypothetical protein
MTSVLPCGAYSAASFTVPADGQHVLDHLHLLAQIVDGGRQLVALAFHVCEPLARHVERRLKLRRLLVAHVVEVEKLADFLEAEAEALAAQDQLQARAVAAGEQAFLPLAAGEQKLLGFVEAQRAGRHVERVAHLADGHFMVGHGRSENSTSTSSGQGMCPRRPLLQVKMTFT